MVEGHSVSNLTSLQQPEELLESGKVWRTFLSGVKKWIYLWIKHIFKFSTIQSPFSLNRRLKNTHKCRYVKRTELMEITCLSVQHKQTMALMLKITQLTDAQISIGLHVPKWLKFQGWVLDKAKKVEFSTGPDKTIKDKWLSYNPVGSSVKAEVVTVR